MNDRQDLRGVAICVGFAFAKDLWWDNVEVDRVEPVLL